jgi:hypothetical protein
MKIFSKKISSIIIFIIFLNAFLLRIYGLNWDDNNHLHPDERFLTMVVNDIKLPTSISQYFDTNISPLNPYNYSQYQFFVYGTFPIFLVKYLAVLLHLDNYNHITLLGRLLSALFDSGNIILLYLIAKKFLKSFYVILPSLFYSFLVFPLQLSHFFAVDTFLTFFLLLTFTLFTYGLLLPAFIMYGIALSCKISALYFVPIIFLFLLKKYFSTKNKFSFLLLTICYLLITLIFFRIFQPYVFTSFFTLNPIFINNLKTLSSFSSPNINYPPAVQWINRIPLLNSFYNLSVWGIGLFLSSPIVVLIIKYLFNFKFKIKFNLVFLICFWILLLYFYQGLQFYHTMRYFLPIYPFICLILVTLLFKFKINKNLIILLLILNILYSLAFLSIYSRPNSRVQATSWILQNIPFNKTISSEYWDDALPLNYSPYKNISLSLFDFDSPQKWSHLNQSLDQIDYLIMSSNRLWASIPRLPNIYPQSSKFYSDLFSNKTKFIFTKKFVSYPGFQIPFIKSCYYFGPSIYPGIKNHWFEKDVSCLYPGVYLRDDTAEEAFTVYDHPQVLIFSSQNN